MKTLRLLLTVLALVLSTSAALAQEDATPEESAESLVDQIVLRSGTVFSGQIVDGTKSLIDDPNRYEILLQNGTILSILDEGQIERVVKDGQALEDPQQHGGRRRLHEMLTEYQRRKEREARLQEQRRLGLRTEWALGDIRKSATGSEERILMNEGTSLLPEEEVRLSPGARVLMSLASRLRVGLEQGAHLTLHNVGKDDSDELEETFTVSFTLHRGTGWFEVRGAVGGDKPVTLKTQGLTFGPVEGLYELTADEDGLLTLLHYTGPLVSIVRDSDGETVESPPESGLEISRNMTMGSTPLRPRRAPLGDFNEWLEFTEWKPVQVDLPVEFSLVGKPKMEPRPIHPLLGLPSQRFVFQDLQSIRLTGMVPLIENYRRALTSFMADVGRPPTEQEGLAALVEAPEGVENWNGPYLPEGEPLQDPWGRPFVYSLIKTEEGSLIDLYSIGANGIDEQGLGDDLR